MAICNPKINAFTPITTSSGFQNETPHTNIHLVPTNLEMEQLHLLNRLEQFHHIARRLFNQLVSIPHVKPIEPRATPIIVQQGVTYPQGTWPTRLVHGVSESLQVLHHRSVLRGNQGVGTMICSYYHQMGYLFNCYPFVDDRLR